jgi:AcrR family transcriptional regulator
MHSVMRSAVCMVTAVPKLWSETIDTHRSQVRDAVLSATAALVAEHGLRGVTMSQIAANSGIGRATLYKYFPDVESILLAWHERQVGAHLHQLLARRDQAATPFDSLEAVLGAYALICHHVSRQGHGLEITALLHRSEHLAGPGRQLHTFIRDLITEAADDGAVRTDVDPDELAVYVRNALAAAGGLTSEAAVERLVSVTISGITAGETTVAKPEPSHSSTTA